MPALPKRSKGFAEQMYNAAMRTGRANHYLVSMRMPETATDEDVRWAANRIIIQEAIGNVTHALASRALVALSEASGYSLCDLGA